MNLLPDQAARPVRKRCVFYLSGFDPRGATHYHALYRDEAARQAPISGLMPTVGRRQKTAEGNGFWDITAETTEGTVETRYEFLRWDDIVRQHWPRSRTALFTDLIRTNWLNLSTGALLSMFKLAWPPVLAFILPFLLLCTVVVGAPLLSILAAWVVPSSWANWTATLIFFATVAGWFGLAMLLEKKFNMMWVMRSCTFTANQARGLAPELEVRLEQHAQTLLARIHSGIDDEVLIVGHSSGTIMAATVLAEAMRSDPQLGICGPKVALLTLGHCMPMLSTLPKAERFRDDLRCLTYAKDISWIDFSAPPDGSCFALISPLLACGESTEAVENRPKLLSPRFADMFDPSDYAAIRSDRFRCHFQYLMSSKKASLFDYFAITAGEKTLAERFNSSKSVTAYKGLRLF